MTTGEHYNIASASQVASALGGTYKLSGGWYRGKGICHSSDDSDSTSLAFRDPERTDWGLSVKCWKTPACDRDHIRALIEQRTGLTVTRPRRNNAEPQVQVPPKPPVKERKVTGQSVDFPRDLDHPAQKWLADRNLWIPGAPMPAAVRWIDEPSVPGRAGSIVAACAPPATWAGSWPNVPKPTGVHLVRVGDNGEPVKDAGGLNKRSRGELQDAGCYLGNPNHAPRGCHWGVVVVEGLADGLAMAARTPDTVLCLFGTSGFSSREIAIALLGFQRIIIYRDKDAPSSVVDAPGFQAARNLKRLIRELPGGEDKDIEIVRAPQGKDPAEMAASQPPLEKGTAEERKFAEELHAEGLPVWEACRMAWAVSRA